MENSKFILTAIEVAGIQNYIFGSNELKENVGASELVRQATEEKAFEVLVKELELKSNLRSNYKIDDSIRINEDSSVDVELFYSAGGNSILIFRSLDQAKSFSYQLSSKLQKEVPGLPLYVAHKPFDFDSDNLARVLSDLFTELGKERSRIGPSASLLGLSVTASCKSTGLPANVEHPDEKADDHNIAIKPVISSIVAPKYHAKDEAESRIKNLVQSTEDVPWTNELDKIGENTGKSREESYIAVVHIDGNSMGKRFLNLNKLFQEIPKATKNNRAFITAQRVFSDEVDAAYSTALKNTIQHLVKKHLENQVDPQAPLPLRPIVFGGDDITWVCRGELGLPLAIHFLKELEKQKIKGLKRLLSDAFGETKDFEALIGHENFQSLFKPFEEDFIPYAAAGVAIVKTHYPFSRAYDMSEQLLKSAKERISAVEEKVKEKDDTLIREGFGVDWHFSLTGLQGSLDQIREREFTSSTPKQEQLCGRPYVFGNKMSKTWRTWDNFYGVLDGFLKENWNESNNKLAAFREAIRQGPIGVEQFHRARRDQSFPKLALPGKSDPVAIEDGNQDEDGITRSVYFDAVEIINHFEEL